MFTYLKWWFDRLRNTYSSQQFYKEPRIERYYSQTSVDNTMKKWLRFKKWM